MSRAIKNFSKSKILKAIRNSYGIISNIAKSLQCDWHTAERNINRFPDTIQALQNEKEGLLDFVESKAIKAISDGDGAMIRYYLSTIGRKRGYTENDDEPSRFNSQAKIELVLVDKPLSESK